MKLSVLGKICQTFPKLEQHKSKASRENEFHKKKHCHRWKVTNHPSFYNFPHIWCSCSSISSSVAIFIHFHLSLSIFSHIHSFWSTFNHFHPLLSIFIHRYPFSSMSFYWIQNIVIRAIGSQLSEKKIRLKNQFVFIILVIHVILSHSPVIFWRKGFREGESLHYAGFMKNVLQWKYSIPQWGQQWL